MIKMHKDIINSFKKAKDNKEVLLIKNFMPEVPTWQDFINNIYNKAHSETLSHFTHEKHLQDIVIYNYLDLFVSHAANENNENGIKGLQKVINLLKNNLNVSFFNIKSLINFAGNEADYWIHEDQHDVISWHCIGNMEWRIYKNDKHESYYLSPGDLLFCPAGIKHEVIITEPRASIILDFNPPNK